MYAHYILYIYMCVCVYIYIYINKCFVSLKHLVQIVQKIHAGFKPNQIRNLIQLRAVCSLLITAIS